MGSTTEKRWAPLGCALAWLALASAGYAQPAVPEVTLRDALRRAQTDAPAVAAAAAQYALRQAEADAIGGEDYPVFTLRGSSGYAFDNRVVLPDQPRIDSESLTAEGSVTLEWAALDLARGARSDAADEAARAPRFSARTVERDAMLLAAELYVESAATAALTRDAELSLARRAQQEGAIADLVRAGTRSPLDLERAKVETVSARYALAASQNDELAAGAALAAALGRPATQPVRASERALDALQFELAPSRAMAAARSRRPELAGEAALIDARREEYAAAIGARFPTVGVAAAASLSYLDVRRGLGIDGHQYGGSALVYLRWRGLDPTVWVQADVASAAVAEAQRGLAAREHEIAAGAVAASHAVQRAKIELERTVEVLRAAEVTRDAQNGRYRAGMASMLELLDAEDLEQEARRERIEAERDYRLAGVRLLWAVGRLDALAR